MEPETVYDLVDSVVMVCQYLWGTLQAHRVMDYLLRYQFRQHPEVALHITLYLCVHRALRVEVVVLNQKVEFPDKTIIQMGKTCKDLMSTVDSLTNKSNRLIRK